MPPWLGMQQPASQHAMSASQGFSDTPLMGLPAWWLLQGVKLVFYDSVADILLLEIPEPIPDKFKPYLMGFDASVGAVPQRAVSIHHPNGGLKRISYANDRWGDGHCPYAAVLAGLVLGEVCLIRAALLPCSGSVSTSFTAYTFPPEEIQPTDATHFQASALARVADETVCMHACLRTSADSCKHANPVLLATIW